MKEYTIAPVQGQIDWSGIPALEIGNHNWRPPVDISAQAQICYDENGLHVHLRAWEKNVRGEITSPLGNICDDSCLEFFFRPDENDPRYFNIEINPNGFSFVGLCYDRDRNCRLAPDYARDIFEKQINRLADGWELYYTIPVSFVRVFFPEFELNPGRKIYANCFKCGDLTEKDHYLSWSPITCEEENFHRICDFGLMVLG